MKSPKPVKSTMLPHLTNQDKMKRQSSISVASIHRFTNNNDKRVFFYPWLKQIFSVSVMSGCYWAEGLMTAGQNSHLLHLPYLAPKVTMETPPAHLMPLFLSKPRPREPPSLTISEVFSACSVCNACAVFLQAHTHHLDHKVSSTLGTLELWSAGSSP